MMKKIGIPMPESDMASNIDEAKKIAASISYPVMVRPSYVLGGREMEVIHDEEDLCSYAESAVKISTDRPIFVDRFLLDTLEVETDALSDGVDVFIPAIMEHIEFAGVHSGGSACVITPISISKEQKKH